MPSQTRSSVSILTDRWVVQIKGVMMVHSGDLGRRLAERRAELGLPLDVVADRAGVDPHYLEYLESDGATTTPTTLGHLAIALATTPRVLLGIGLDQPVGFGPPPNGTPEVEILDRTSCLRLIRPGGVGRVVFLDRQQPVALPVSFRMLDDDVVFRTGTHSIYVAVHEGGTVSFEVDHLDPSQGQAWSVLLTGSASLVRETDDLRRIAALHCDSWSGVERPHDVRLVAGRITGRRISRRV
jgi:nitroimidazol reductase NimA-like FMN-containing flavoprotein (pyridoxamine 5'-phosphate oxidase superfamily)